MTASLVQRVTRASLQWSAVFGSSCSYYLAMKKFSDCHIRAAVLDRRTNVELEDSRASERY